jgi:hypothetical protein
MGKHRSSVFAWGKKWFKSIRSSEDRSVEMNLQRVEPFVMRDDEVAAPKN